jgi:arginyl-tRNA synthetase
MIKDIIQDICKESLNDCYNINFPIEKISVQSTRKDLEGDFTIVVFPFLSFSKKSPEETAKEIGNNIIKHNNEIHSFQVVKGFLNLQMAESFWIKFARNLLDKKNIVTPNTIKEKIVIEFSSPNTNKPLHLGHIRNNLLGCSIANIMEAAGKEVIRVNLVNDRGIHICKSMLAWEKWGNNETPDTSNIKGDHLVGKYYVLFDKKYKEEIAELVQSGIEEKEARKQAPILHEAQELLRKWEKNDKDVIALWEKMNSWVYDGFKVTYKKLGIEFNKTYYESQTYLLGKKIVEEGLKKNILFKEEDSSIWASLSDKNMDNKLLLRGDGTSVYMTQDLGTAKLRMEEWNADKLIYVVGNEQIHHFNVLEIVLDKLGYNWSKQLHHLSYGMVELPEGKMKSREGTVVDADNLIKELISTAQEKTSELGKIDDFTEEQAKDLHNKLGLGAIKYFILKVDPKKNMLFNPEESIDFNGNTGPFIQYTHARICSLLNKSDELDYRLHVSENVSIHPKEKQLLITLNQFEEIVQEAAETMSPAIIANYIYELVKTYNSYYQEVPILKEQEKELIEFRLTLSSIVKRHIAYAMKLLGIEVPEKM